MESTTGNGQRSGKYYRKDKSPDISYVDVSSGPLEIGMESHQVGGRLKHGKGKKKKVDYGDIFKSCVYPTPAEVPKNWVFADGLYQLGDQIGGGAHGKVYEAINLETKEKVAVKLEHWTTKKTQILRNEDRILHRISGHDGFPRWRWAGDESGFYIIVMDMLGPSLSDLLGTCNGIFSLKTTLMIADQCLARIESLHSLGYIHGDVKPDNFVMGVGELHSNQVFMIDFGLSKSYIDVMTNQHIRPMTGRPFSGTLRYASIHTHSGVEPSRRDDLESLGYMLVQFLKAKLPWSGYKPGKLETLEEKVFNIKKDMPVEVLCEGLPECFSKYFQYCFDLTFDATPDYGHLRQMFQAEMTRRKFIYDSQFDWILYSSAYRAFATTMSGIIAKNDYPPDPAAPVMGTDVQQILPHQLPILPFNHNAGI